MTEKKQNKYGKMDMPPPPHLKKNIDESPHFLAHPLFFSSTPSLRMYIHLLFLGHNFFHIYYLVDDESATLSEQKITYIMVRCIKLNYIHNIRISYIYISADNFNRSETILLNHTCEPNNLPLTQTLLKTNPFLISIIFFIPSI
jgi:hypothetical protein